MPRAATKFALTIPRFEDTHTLELLFKNLPVERYLISKERHHDLQIQLLEQVQYHLHAYFEVDNPAIPTALPELSGLLRGCFEALVGEDAVPGFDLQQCKSPDKWRKYCTKEDLEPIVAGIPLDALHIRYQVYWHAQRGPFAATHPLIVSHSNQWRLLERMWGEFRRVVPRPLHVNEGEFPEQPWYPEAREWWRSWQEDPWVFKKKHLVLEGPPDSGKTTLARSLVGNGRGFYPSSSKDFALMGLNNEDYDYVLWDDFDFNHVNRRNLLLLMQGDCVSIDVKCSVPYVLTWQKPIIFTTNFVIGDLGFLARVKLIKTEVV